MLFTCVSSQEVSISSGCRATCTSSSKAVNSSGPWRGSFAFPSPRSTTKMVDQEALIVWRKVVLWQAWCCHHQKERTRFTFLCESLAGCSCFWLRTNWPAVQLYPLIESWRKQRSSPHQMFMQKRNCAFIHRTFAAKSVCPQFYASHKLCSCMCSIAIKIEYFMQELWVQKTAPTDLVPCVAEIIVCLTRLRTNTCESQAGLKQAKTLPWMIKKRLSINVCEMRQ